jgi:hypothetical protein
MTAGAQGIADTPMVELGGETYEEPRFSVRCPVPPSTRFAEWMAAAI